MRKYNPKYYEKNKERHNLVEKNVENKSKLREAKTEYIFNYFGNICPHCSGVEEGETKITIEVVQKVWRTRRKSLRVLNPFD